MSEPKFKLGDKAEFQVSNLGWTPVYIESHALQWAGRYVADEPIYLVQCVEIAARTTPPFLVNEHHLRRVERWEPCPGRHRVAARLHNADENVWEHMERRVD